MSSDSPLSDAEARDLVKLVEFKVRRFLRDAPARKSDDADFIQEVLVRVLGRLSRFDPERASLRTFIARITESALWDVGRRRRAAKRNPMRDDVSRGDGTDSTHRGTTHRRADCGQSSPDWIPDARAEAAFDQRDLQLDLAEAIAALPPGLRTLAEDLREWTPTEVAEREGVPRGTVYRRIASLRGRWEDGTLRRYLDS